MPLQADLVISFRASSKARSTKQQLIEDARKAEQQYNRILETLTYSGLRAVGRRGDSLGHLLIFVTCPKSNLAGLVKRERHSDFMYGLPTSHLPSEEVNLDAEPLATSERLRLVYSYVTSMPGDGGLGISAVSPEWDLVEDIMLLHDKDYNDAWIKRRVYNRLVTVQLENVRGHFGENLAFYFAFLSTYTQALMFPAAVGVLFFVFGSVYSPIYSVLIVLWAIAFVEYWRAHERILALRFGTRGAFKVEQRRIQYKPGFSWWQRELRVIASLPVILTFAAVLSALLTAIFVLEAFVAQIYQGPGYQVFRFTPTICFVLLVPRLVGVYRAISAKLTTWENHAHSSTHEASLTLKSFVSTGLVAYLGLALSAFVYLPFGDSIMQLLTIWLSTKLNVVINPENPNIAMQEVNTPEGHVNSIAMSGKLDSDRLRNQMFAFTVTNQIINTATEIGMPYVPKILDHIKSRFRKKNQDVGSSASSSSSSTSGGSRRKKVVFEDEKAKGGQEELQFLEQVREELALPEYSVFDDYSEMIMQFGYVAVWSTIWPLAPLMALINNILELKSDTLKIAVHRRRLVPARIDTIGPRLDALTFLTWLGALTNSTLVYLFHPRHSSMSSTMFATNFNTTTFTTTPNATLVSNFADLTPVEKVQKSFFDTDGKFSSAGKELMVSAALIALVASHGFIIVRVLIKHLVGRIVWKGSAEVVDRERRDREVKERFLNGMVATRVSPGGRDLQRMRSTRDLTAEEDPLDSTAQAFWANDEGLEEIQRIAKEA